jgi:TrmH family RNA methyltransferase
MVSAQEIKHIRSLKYKKYRIYYNQFIIEGSRSLLAATESKERLIKVYISESYQNNTNWGHIEKNLNDTSTYIIPDNVMVKLTDIKTPPGIIGICSIPERQVPDINSLENWLYLDKIRDPGNVGTILRTAAWFGVKNVALSPKSIDIYNPKVVRGAMGAHFHLSIYGNVEISAFLNDPFTIIGAFMKGEILNDLDLDVLAPWILILGNEARGISQDINGLIHKKVAIPRLGSGESLNVAVAGGILMQKLTLS